MATQEIQRSDSEREQALVRIKRRRDLQTHALSFLVVNAAVWAIWATTGSGYPWPALLTGVWAIGLLFNAWDVHARRQITDLEVQHEIEPQDTKL
jgi:hypothetical protein